MPGINENIESLRHETWKMIEDLRSDFNAFIESIRWYGIEYHKRYYGPYMATVESNEDPDGLGRVQLNCPRALLPEKNEKWVLPMTPAFAGAQEFFPPEKGDVVWLFFDNGSFDVPLCYIGGFYTKGEIDKDLDPKGKIPVKRGWVTPKGNKIILDDTKDGETITIKRKDKMHIKITDKKISVGKQGGKYEPMMRGTQVKKWLEEHVHPHPYGPTDPCKKKLPSDCLSEDTETS